MMDKKKFNPLPQNVRPSLYQLVIDSDLETFLFAGKLDITLTVSQETKTVILNSASLTVDSAKLHQNGANLDAAISYKEEDEQVIFSFNEVVKVGDAVLKIDYKGVIADDLKGFYRSPDTAHPGKFCAATQFEPVDARRALPCFDEPAIKAQFEVTLIADKQYTLLSNTNQVTSEDHPTDKTKRVVTFARTPVMSTYLLAFSIGLHDYVEGVDSNGVTHRVYADCGKREESTYALDISIKALQFLSDFFKIKYPLPKCDHIALKAFDCGAMENWGLVTYRSSALLVDPKGSGGYLKQRVHEIVCHELAHQWFGNLVTMKWWTDLWLNEGFAAFLQYMVPDFIKPDFEMWSQFVSNTVISALSLDSLRNSHPVEVDVGHPSEIREIFDQISYCKGASLNRMLFHFLGKDKFQLGLFNYLTHFSYRNAETNDLWRFLGEAAGLDVQSLMTTWTRQTGFPMVTIEESEQLTPTVRRFKLSQSRHLDDASPDELETLWQIPIRIVSQSSPQRLIYQFVMRSRSETIEVNGVAPNEWVHFNPDFLGFYLVKYPKENLDLLRKASELSVKEEALSPESRMSLIFELLRLSVSGASPVTNLLDFLSALKNEENSSVWSVIVSSLGRLNAVLVGSQCDPEKVNKFKLNLFEKAAQTVGLKPPDNAGDESHLTQILRSLLLFQMGKLGHKPTVDYCRDLVESERPIPPSIRDSVLKTYVFNADGAEQIDVVVNIAKNSSNLEEMVACGTALGYAQTEHVALHAIEFLLSGNVQSSDTIYSFRAFATNYKLGNFLWNFFENNFDRLSSGVCGSPDSMTFSSILDSFTTPHYSLGQMEKMDAFFRKHPVDGFNRKFSQNKETIALHAKCIEREQTKLKAYFDSL